MCDIARMRERLGYVAVVLLWALFGSIVSFAAEPTPTPKLDNLLVYGEGWTVAIKEPEGWMGDTRNASRWGANVLFYRKGQNPADAGTTVIRVLIAEKTDDDIARDLQADMEDYKERYPDVRFKDFEVSHPTYRSSSKLFLIPTKASEYVVYLNPGPATRDLLSVSMNHQGGEASSEDQVAYRAVVRSLNLLAPRLAPSPHPS